MTGTNALIVTALTFADTAKEFADLNEVPKNVSEGVTLNARVAAAYALISIADSLEKIATNGVEVKQ